MNQQTKETENTEKGEMGKTEKTNLFLILNAAALFILSAAVLYSVLRRPGSTSSEAAELPPAVPALLARGLYDHALSEMESFRRTHSLSPEQDAKILMKMAKIADENLNDCERALPYYTMAAAVDPETAEQADKAAVVCLEKTGRKRQAQALLRELTDAGSAGVKGLLPEEAASSPVVAVLDGRSVTWKEVEAALYPQGLDKDLSIEEKMRAVKTYLFSAILAKEAVKNGLEQDPQVQAGLEQMKRNLLASRFLQKEGIQPEDQESLEKLWKELAPLYEARIFLDE